MNINELQKRVESLITNLNDLVLKSAMDNETFIADFNTNQLSKGLTNKNEEIQPELASDEYARIKKVEGGQAPLYIPDLRDTGSFYRGFYAKNVNKEIIINSTDKKTEDLRWKYKNIFGLTDDSLSELSKIIQPELCNHILLELTK